MTETEKTRTNLPGLPTVNIADRAGCEMDPEDIDIPIVKIVQGTSKNKPDDCSLGDWYCASRGESYGHTIKMLPIACYKSRTYWNKITTEPPRCISSDFKFPDSGQSPPDPKGVIHKACLNCWFGLPQRDAETNKMKWTCSKQYNFFSFLLLPDDSRMVCRFMFQRTGFNIGKSILNQETMKGGFVYDAAFELRTQMKTEPQEHYVPRHRSLGSSAEVCASAREEAIALFQQWRAIYLPIITRQTMEDIHQDTAINGESQAESTAVVIEESDSSEITDELPF